MSSAEIDRPAPDDTSTDEASPAPAEPAAKVSWRFLISPRWLGWHACMVVAVLGMLALGYWQYRRAMEGNALSWAYTFEWPMFAIFAVVFWAKTIRDEFRPPDIDEVADKPEFAVGLAASEINEAEGKELMLAEPDDPDLAAYNAYLERLNDQVRGHGRWHGLK
jgi:DNA-binding transcriptional regulator of glucitol operon